MASVALKKRLDVFCERRAGIDAEIEQPEAQLDAQERAAQRGADVLEVEPVGICTGRTGTFTERRMERRRAGMWGRRGLRNFAWPRLT